MDLKEVVSVSRGLVCLKNEYGTDEGNEVADIVAVD